MPSTELANALTGLRYVLAQPVGNSDGLAWNDAFHSALDRLTALDDTASVAPLLLLLDDGHEFQDVLWSQMHAAEHFPTEPYIVGLVEAVPTLATQSPEWARLLTIRVISSDECRPVLAKALASAPIETVAAFEAVFQKLKRSDPQLFGAGIEEIASAVDKIRTAQC